VGLSPDKFEGENKAGTEKVIMVVSVVVLVLLWLLLVVGGVVVGADATWVGTIMSGCIRCVGSGGVCGVCQDIWCW
jgi:hypothetical protein